MVCYEIMDGKKGALDTLESFADKYPHQVAAVKAEVAYFNLDYEKALALDCLLYTSIPSRSGRWRLTGRSTASPLESSPMACGDSIWKRTDERSVAS